MIMEETKDKNKKVSGAGFVILRVDSPPPCGKAPKMLALITHGGIYDIPKGHIEEGETALEAAKRECFEECSMLIPDKDLLFNSNGHVNGPLTTFCAKSSGTPTITVNPETLIMEHASCKWITKQEFISNCYNYLKPAVNYFYSEYDNDYNP